MSEDLVRQLAEELEALTRQHPTVAITLAPHDVFTLVGVLQLALRHPRFHGSTREITERIKEQLIDALATAPTVYMIARRGDHVEFDS